MEAIRHVSSYGLYQRIRVMWKAWYYLAYAGKYYNGEQTLRSNSSPICPTCVNDDGISSPSGRMAFNISSENRKKNRTRVILHNPRAITPGLTVTYTPIVIIQFESMLDNSNSFLLDKFFIFKWQMIKIYTWNDYISVRVNYQVKRRQVALPRLSTSVFNKMIFVDFDVGSSMTFLNFGWLSRSLTYHRVSHDTYNNVSIQHVTMIN